MYMYIHIRTCTCIIICTYVYVCVCIFQRPTASIQGLKEYKRSRQAQSSTMTNTHTPCPLPDLQLDSTIVQVSVDLVSPFFFLSFCLYLSACLSLSVSLSLSLFLMKTPPKWLRTYMYLLNEDTTRLRRNFYVHEKIVCTAAVPKERRCKPWTTVSGFWPSSAGCSTTSTCTCIIIHMYTFHPPERFTCTYVCTGTYVYNQDIPCVNGSIHVAIHVRVCTCTCTYVYSMYKMYK